MPVLGTEAHQEAGQGEGGRPSCQEDGPGQLGVEEVGEDGQKDGGEDEDEDEGGSCQELKCLPLLAPLRPQSIDKCWLELSIGQFNLDLLMTHRDCCPAEYIQELHASLNSRAGLIFIIEVDNVKADQDI